LVRRIAPVPATVPHAVLHDDVHALEERDVTQHVALHGDDVGELARLDRAHLVVNLHRDRRPVGGAPDGRHGVHAKDVHQASSSRQVDELWNFIGMPLSVPTSKTTPASRSCSNLRLRVGRRCGVSWK